MSIDSCRFESNQAGNEGGAILVKAGSTDLLPIGAVAIKNTRFLSNQATIGGAISVYPGGTAAMEACVFLNNLASSDGGAIFHSGETLGVYDCAFESNFAPTGLAIWTLYDIDVVNSSFIAGDLASVSSNALFLSTSGATINFGAVCGPAAQTPRLAGQLRPHLPLSRVSAPCRDSVSLGPRLA